MILYGRNKIISIPLEMERDGKNQFHLLRFYLINLTMYKVLHMSFKILDDVILDTFKFIIFKLNH